MHTEIATCDLISVPALCKQLAVTRSGLRSLAQKDATFPRPIKLGRSRQSPVRFDAGEVAQWLASKKAER